MGSMRTNKEGTGETRVASPRSPLERTLWFAFMVILSLTFGAAAILSCCSPLRDRLPIPLFKEPGPPMHAGPVVRVRLADGVGRVTVGASAAGQWADEPGGAWTRAVEEGEWEVTAAGSLVRVSGEAEARLAFRFSPSDGLFELDGQRYRGELVVEADGRGTLSATEVVELDDYVRGVVGNEMSPGWPADALKAQAVAARTFAVYRTSGPGAARKWVSRSDMAYKGVKGESGAADEAVLATADRILTWEGQPLAAYFHSCCGGHTAAVEKVYGGRAIPPLAGVPCTACRDCPSYRWTASLELSDMAAKLAARGVRDLQEVSVGDPDETGRPTDVVINGSEHMPINTFRLALGAGAIKSTWFTVAEDWGKLKFEGQGWGHGVGMCQCGAEGLARLGNTAEEILRYYFPGSQIVSLY